MYMLLTGEPPFSGNSNEEILANVTQKDISFTNNKWGRVSKESLAFVKKMLTRDYNKRISANEALNDSWFSCYECKKSNEDLGMLECIGNLKMFNVTSIMQKAALSYMAAHLISKEEERKLREIFTKLDTNHNGLLSIEELAEGYLLLFNGDQQAAKMEAKRTMKILDINNNGTIDYNGMV